MHSIVTQTSVIKPQTTEREQTIGSWSHMKYAFVYNGGESMGTKLWWGGGGGGEKNVFICSIHTIQIKTSDTCRHTT